MRMRDLACLRSYVCVRARARVLRARHRATWRFVANSSAALRIVGAAGAPAPVRAYVLPMFTSVCFVFIF